MNTECGVGKMVSLNFYNNNIMLELCVSSILVTWDKYQQHLHSVVNNNLFEKESGKIGGL